MEPYNVRLQIKWKLDNPFQGDDAGSSEATEKRNFSTDGGKYVQPVPYAIQYGIIVLQLRQILFIYTDKKTDAAGNRGRLACLYVIKNKIICK